MSIIVYRTNKVVFYVDNETKNSSTKKIIINKYIIPIEDKRSKVSFDKKISLKRSSKVVPRASSSSGDFGTLSKAHTELNNNTLTEAPKRKKLKFKIQQIFDSDVQPKLENEVMMESKVQDEQLTVSEINQSIIPSEIPSEMQPEIQSTEIRSEIQSEIQSGIRTEITAEIQAEIRPINKELISMRCIYQKINITPGKLKQLKFGHTSAYESVEDKWEPFICKIEKRFFSKKINRYVLQVSDGDGARYQVHIASQLFKLIQNNELIVGDWIKVNYYSATNMCNEKPRIVIFVNIEKIDASDIEKS